MADSDPLLSAFEDGFGARVADTDPAGVEALERLYVSDTFKTVVEQLRERTGRLTNLRHIRFVRVRSIERERDKEKRLYIVADATPGIRLARVLQFSQIMGLTVDVDTVLHVLRELLPALALLHDSRSVTHGAVGPERLLVTDKGRVVVGDHMFGSALDKLRLSRARLWKDLRVPMPPAAGVPRFDKRSDVSQVGMVALAMLLGRPLSDEEFPTRIPALLDSLTETHRGGHTERLSKELRAWLERALPIDARKPFLEMKEAQAALEDVVAGRKAYSPNSAALKAFVARFLTEFSRRAPERPETVTPAPAETATPALVEIVTPAPAEPAMPALIETVMLTPVEAERVPATVVPPEDAAPPGTADRQAEPYVPPARPVASRVAGEVGAESARGAESASGQPVPSPETLPKAQQPTVAESAPKRRGGSKKKAPAQEWHPSIDETEAEEIRRLEAELSRLADLEAAGPPATPHAPAAASAESDAEHAIDLASALDLLADEAVPGNDDGAWVLEVSAAVPDGAVADPEPARATVSEPVADLEPDIEVAIDLDDAFVLESDFGAVSPSVSAAERIDLSLNAEPSDGLVVEHFGIAPVQIEPRAPEPAEHALPLADLVDPLALDETASSSPAAPVPECALEVDAHASETVRDTDVSPHAEPVAAMGNVAGDETVAVEPQEDDADCFKLTPPDAIAVAHDEAALVEAERLPQAELDFDFECESVESEEPVDDSFVLVPWTPLALDTEPSAGSDPEEIAQLACGDVTPRLPFEAAEAVSDEAPDDTDEGPAEAPSIAALVLCPAPEVLAQPVPQLAQPVSEEWLATGTDGPADRSFDGPLAYDAAGRARSRRLERYLGVFDQPRVWAVPQRVRAPEADTSGLSALEDQNRQADPPDAADSRLTEAAVTSSPAEQTVATEPEAEQAATTATECVLAPVDAPPPTALVEPVASLTSTEAFDAPPVEADTVYEPPIQPDADLPSDASASLDPPAVDAQTHSVVEALPHEPQEALACDLEVLPTLPLAIETAPAPEVTPSIALASGPTLELALPIAVATERELGDLPSTAGEPEPTCEPAPALDLAPTEPIEIAAHVEPELALDQEAVRSEIVGPAATALPTAGEPALCAALVFDSSPEAEFEAEPNPEPSVLFAPSPEPEPAAAALEPLPEPEPAAAALEHLPEPEPVAAPEAATEAAPVAAREASPETPPEAAPEAAPEAQAEADRDGELVSSAGDAVPEAADESVDDTAGDDEPDSSTAPGAATDARAAAAPTARGSKRSRRRKKKASGESLMRRSSFAPVRIERPPMPAPPWLRGKTAAVSADGEVSTPHAPAQTASTSSPPAGSTLSPAPQTPSPSALSFGPPVAARGATPPPVFNPTSAGHGEDHGSAATPSPVPVALRVEQQGAGLAPEVHADPLRAVSSRPTLSVGRLAAMVFAGLLVEAVLLGGWAMMSRPDTTGRLLVVTRPKGIRVMVDGTVVGDTPYAASVAPGKHAVQLTGRSVTRTLEIDVPPSAQGGAFVRWPTEAARGSVTISSVPDGARVSIDGEEQGTAPVTVHDLIAGSHTVTVTGKRGSVETTVDVKADRTVSLEVPIYSGWVSVFSAVPLDISENGKLLGNTESDRLMLGAGAHTLELSNVSLGYRETREVQVVPGKVVPVSVELPSAPLFIDVEPGAEIWVDGERVGYTPAMDLRAPIGTRVILLKREGQPDERHVVSVRLPGPTRVGPTQP